MRLVACCDLARTVSYPHERVPLAARVPPPAAGALLVAARQLRPASCRLACGGWLMPLAATASCTAIRTRLASLRTSSVSRVISNVATHSMKRTSDASAPEELARASKRMPATTSAADEEIGGRAESPPRVDGRQQSRDNAKYTKRGNSKLVPITGSEAAFAELGDVHKLYRGTTAKQRQHVNPLTEQNQRLLDPPAGGWGTVFKDPTLPLHLDIGCGSGRFVLIRALRLKGRANVLGLEIRGKLVERAQIWRERLGESRGLDNAHLMSGNATITLQHLLASYPGQLEVVSIQYPDPHFKKRHLKRRVVQPDTVRQLVELMAKPKPGARGSRLVLQGDVPEPLRHIRNMVERHSAGAFALSPENHGLPPPAGWEDMAASLGCNEHDGADVDGVIASNSCGIQDDEGTDEPVQRAKSEGTDSHASASAQAGLLRDEWEGEPEEFQDYDAKWAKDVLSAPTSTHCQMW